MPDHPVPAGGVEPRDANTGPLRPLEAYGLVNNELSAASTSHFPQSKSAVENSRRFASARIPALIVLSANPNSLPGHYDRMLAEAKAATIKTIENQLEPTRSAHRDRDQRKRVVPEADRRPQLLARRIAHLLLSRLDPAQARLVQVALQLKLKPEIIIAMHHAAVARELLRDFS